MRQPPHVIGVDLGEERCTAVVLNRTGQALGSGHCDFPKGNHASLKVLPAASLPAMKAAVGEVGLDLGEVQSVAWALDRTTPPERLCRFAELAAEMLPGAAVTAVSRTVATLVGGIRAHRGIALIVDSGMVAYGENGRGECAQSGGWGHLLERGSAYDLAIEALRTVAVAAEDERQPISLTERILHALDIENPSDVSRWLHDPERRVSEVADLAPLVLQEAEARDLVAVEAVARGADALADALAGVARRLGFQGCHFPVVLSGHLLTTSAFYREVVTQSILTRLPNTQPRLVRVEAATGAALIALESLGYPLDAEKPQEAPARPWASEHANVLAHDLDLRTSLQMVGFMHIEDRRAVDAVDPVLPEIAATVDAIAVRMRQGGRLIYVGGGTSGRLGVLDASECPSTFNTSPEQVVGVMAGGVQALLSHGERAEDDTEAGRQALQDLAVGPRDSVVGITASGRTPFTLGAMAEARRQGALTIALVCNLPSPLAQMTDHVIAPLVGPEALSGSTRLKAGTAQKLVLNMVSTAVMVRLGKTYGNLMVDVRQDNEKLRGRAQRIVAQICNVRQEAAEETLDCTDGDVKAAVICLLTGSSAAAARECVARAGGMLRTALTEMSNP